jgi:hypothetical protein
MSSPSPTKQKEDGETHRRVKDASGESTGTKDRAQTNTVSDQAHGEETSDIDDPQGEAARSDGKVSSIKIANDADTAQLSTPTRPFSNLKICLQFALPTTIQEELKKMQVSDRSEPCLRRYLARTTKTDQRLLNGPNNLLFLITIHLGMDH